MAEKIVMTSEWGIVGDDYKSSVHTSLLGHDYQR